MDATDPQQEAVVVFRGSRTACFEFGLVLEARGLAHELLELDATWALQVAPEVREHAREELARYVLERAGRREEPPAIVPFTGAAAGAIGYGLILLGVAYCAGIGSFGADWLSVGALDASIGGGREWWRALTALTLHLDQAHLLSNLLFGIGAGSLASLIFGPGVAWASILAAGALANYLEMLIAVPAHRAVGASTAVFAALGLLTGFAWRRRLTLRERRRYRWTPLMAGVGLLTLLGAGTEHVDVLGHLLGFLLGAAFGWAYARAGLPRSRDARLQLAAGLAALSSLGGAWALALRHVP